MGDFFFEFLLSSQNIWTLAAQSDCSNIKWPQAIGESKHCAVSSLLFLEKPTVCTVHCPCGSHYNMQSNAKEVSAAYSSSKRQFFTWLVAGSKKVTTFTLGFTLIAVISIMQFKKTLRSSTRFFGLHKITVISNWEFHPKTKTCCV